MRATDQCELPVQGAFDFSVLKSASKSSPKPTAPRLVSVSRINETVQERVSTLPDVSANLFYKHRVVYARDLQTTFEKRFSDFWLKRYRQHADTHRFCARVAKAFGLSVQTAIDMYLYLGLPECCAKTEKSMIESRFSSSLYLTASENLRDPLDDLYKKTCYRLCMEDAFQTYLGVYGWLPPESVPAADIKFILSTYPIALPVVAQLLQIEPNAFRQYVKSMGWTVARSYGVGGPVFRELISSERHTRFVRIVMRCAQSVYTHQAVPIKEICLRLGITPITLFSTAEAVEGEWRQPQLHTVQHVIEHTTAMHMQNGGLLRVI